MKTLSKPTCFTLISAAAAFVCLLLRQWLLSTGLDEKGLLLPDHPGNWLSLLLAGAMGLLTVAVWLRKREYRLCPTPLSALGACAAAVGTAWSAWKLLQLSDRPAGLAAAALGFAAAVCYVVYALCLRSHKRMPQVLHFPPVLFFLLFLVQRYQQWSSEPEVQRYAFQVIAGALLLFSTYYRAASDITKKGRTARFVLSRCAVFFCIAAIPGSSFPLLYGSAALMLMLDGSAAGER